MYHYCLPFAIFLEADLGEQVPSQGLQDLFILLQAVPYIYKQERDFVVAVLSR